MPPALQSNRTAKNIATIKRLVAESYGVTVAQIDSRAKPRILARARHVAMYIVRKLITRPVPFSDKEQTAPMSYPDIAASFKRSDHMSSIYAVQTIADFASVHKGFAGELEKLVETCRKEML